MSIKYMMHNAIGSFSFDVIIRILAILRENGSLRKTNLAVKAGLNYGACVRYIKLMKQLGWIQIVSDNNDWDNVTLSTYGRQINKKLLFFPFPDNNSNDGKGNEAIEIVAEQQNQELDRPENVGNFPINDTDRLYSKSEEDTSAVTHTNIMLVDDEPDALLTYESFLSSTGQYNIESFSDSEKALVRFASMKPAHYDLVILDIRMPDINGLQLYQRMKAINPSLKILFLSSLDAAKELASILPGVNLKDVIKKPVDKEKFVKIVNRIMTA